MTGIDVDGGIETLGVGISGLPGLTGTVDGPLDSSSTGVGSGACQLSSCCATKAFSSAVVGIASITSLPARLASLASSLSSKSLMSIGETFGSLKGWITLVLSEAGFGISIIGLVTGGVVGSGDGVGVGVGVNGCCGWGETAAGATGCGLIGAGVAGTTGVGLGNGAGWAGVGLAVGAGGVAIGTVGLAGAAAPCGPSFRTS